MVRIPGKGNLGVEGSPRFAKAEAGDREARGCPSDPKTRKDTRSPRPVLTPDLCLSPVAAVTNYPKQWLN